MPIATRCPRGLASRFRVSRPLGEGGMGAVFLGRQPGLDRLVAVKVLRPDRAEEENLGRFQREAQVMASVEHPHLIRLIDHGVEEGHPYLVMEYVEGRTLAHQLHDDGPVSPARAQEILLPVADALQAIHDVGIIHRDVKPDNVMIEEGGRVLLMDMGLARFARRGAGHTKTGEGKIVGTIEYMSPEMLRGDEMTPAADWYSWGVTAYETLTGDIPFSRDQILEHVVRVDDVWLRPARPDGLSRDDPVASAAAWCMEGRVKKRPAGADHLHRALEGDAEIPRARWAGDGTRPMADSTVAAARRQVLPTASGNLGLALAGIGLVTLSLVGGFLLAEPSVDLAFGREVVLVTDLHGRVSARALTPGAGNTTVELRPPGGGPPRALPVGDVASPGIEAGEAFDARLVQGGGAAGPWHPQRLPPTPRLRWVAAYPITRGVALVGAGDVPPEEMVYETRRGAPARLAPLERGRAGIFWWHQLTLARGPAFLVDPAGALRREYPVRVRPLASPTTLLETVREHLDRGAPYVTNAGVLPEHQRSRADWLALRSYALASWPDLADLREPFLAVLESLVSFEGGKARWSRANLFPVDLERVHPGRGRELAAQLQDSGILAPELDRKLRRYVPTTIRVLQRLNGDLHGLELVGQPDLGASLLAEPESLDRSFIADGLRQSFLASPYVDGSAGDWVAWSLWSRWLRPRLAQLTSAAGAAMHHMFHDFGSRAAPDAVGSPFLPSHRPPPDPGEDLTRFEFLRAWRAIGAVKDSQERAALAWVMLVGSLPVPGHPLSETDGQGALTFLETLPPTPLGEHASYLRSRLEPALIERWSRRFQALGAAP